MNKLCRIYVIRHAESEANILEKQNKTLESLEIGELGADLSEEGQRQAMELAHQLHHVRTFA